MPLPARLIHPIGTVTFLRRYRGDDDRRSCPGPWGYHTAQVEVARDTRPVESLVARHGKGNYADDARWPAHCACGYAFADDDTWQVFYKRLWGTESGRPEAGDLFWATWYDPPHLHGVCPNGAIWDIDGPATGGGHWSRSGEPPAVTVTPSIWVQIAGPEGYHSFLTGGVWLDDIEGRVYPASITDPCY